MKTYIGNINSNEYGVSNQLTKWNRVLVKLIVTQLLQ